MATRLIDVVTCQNGDRTEVAMIYTCEASGEKRHVEVYDKDVLFELFVAVPHLSELQRVEEHVTKSLPLHAHGQLRFDLHLGNHLIGFENVKRPFVRVRYRYFHRTTDCLVDILGRISHTYCQSNQMSTWEAGCYGGFPDPRTAYIAMKKIRGFDLLPQEQEDNEMPTMNTMFLDVTCKEINGIKMVCAIGFNLSGWIHPCCQVYTIGIQTSTCTQFRDEETLLKAFVHLIETEDPDAICGFNSNQVDIPLLVQRMDRYSLCPSTKVFPRVQGPHMLMWPYTHHSQFERIKINCPGRVMLDLYSFLQEESEFNTVPPSLVDYSQAMGILVPPAETPEEHIRRRVALLMAIYETRMVLETLVETCRVASTFPQDALVQSHTSRVTRAIQSISYPAYLHMFQSREGVCDLQEFVCPIIADCPSEMEIRRKSYEGGRVTEPPFGITRGPLVLFDFKSMYPNIIRGYNICTTTWIPNEKIAKSWGLQPEVDYRVMKNGSCFVTDKHLQGIVPRICTMLIQERASVQENIAMLESQNRSYNATKIKALLIRQKTLKWMLNVFYGQFGTMYSPIALYSAAEATARTGRDLTTFVETRVLADPALQVACIYSDTDSLLLKFEGFAPGSAMFPNPELYDKIMQHALCIQDVINNCGAVKNLQYASIGFEKSVIESCMFLGKKTYALSSVKFTKDGHPSRDCIFRGLCVVRSDTMPLVKNVAKSLIEQKLTWPDMEDIKLLTEVECHYHSMKTFVLIENLVMSKRCSTVNKGTFNRSENRGDVVRYVNAITPNGNMAIPLKDCQAGHMPELNVALYRKLFARDITRVLLGLGVPGLSIGKIFEKQDVSDLVGSSRVQHHEGLVEEEEEETGTVKAIRVDGSAKRRKATMNASSTSWLDNIYGN